MDLKEIIEQQPYDTQRAIFGVIGKILFDYACEGESRSAARVLTMAEDVLNVYREVDHA